MHRLPIEFLEKMKILMDETEYEEFVSSFDMPRQHGLRVNTLKISVEDFLEISPFKLEKVPWARDGFYYDGEGENPGKHPNPGKLLNPGKHPYYHAGLYYIQEPSAMLPAEVLDAKPGEYVLDLCAAPGGKTVQIAAGMMGKGLLAANDSNPARLKALIKNIELCGIRNAIVLNETPCNLAVKFCEYFDKILVDAPCSGEGMFRKDENAVKSWKKFKGKDYASIQRNLLEFAGKMLKPGGKYVLLKEKEFPEEFRAFADNNLNAEINNAQINDYLMRVGNDLYQVPRALAMLLPLLEDLRVAKFGWYLGRSRGNKFEPSHSLIMSLMKKDIKKVTDFPAGSTDIARYLKGETLPAAGMASKIHGAGRAGEAGTAGLNNNEFVGVCVDGFTTGWAKLSGNILKNLYLPAGG